MSILANSVRLADALVNPQTPPVGCYLLAFNGLTWDRVRVPNVFKDVSAAAWGSIATAWTPASGKRVRLMGGWLSLSAAASVLFEDNAAASAVKFRTPKFAADTPTFFEIPGGLLLSTADNVLKATSSAAASATGTLWGVEE